MNQGSPSIGTTYNSPYACHMLSLSPEQCYLTVQGAAQESLLLALGFKLALALLDFWLEQTLANLFFQTQHVLCFSQSIKVL